MHLSTDCLDFQKTIVFVDVYLILFVLFEANKYFVILHEAVKTHIKDPNVISHIKFVLAVAHKIGRVKLKRNKCFSWAPLVPAGLCVVRK